jgi:hypothetical protein
MRRLRPVLTLLVFQAVVGIFAVEGFKVVHWAMEPDCPARETGNPAACLFCSHFSLLVGETTPALEPPVPCRIALLGTPDDVLLIPAPGEVLNPGRSPPAAA